MILEEKLTWFGVIARQVSNRAVDICLPGPLVDIAVKVAGNKACLSSKHWGESLVIVNNGETVNIKLTKPKQVECKDKAALINKLESVSKEDFVTLTKEEVAVLLKEIRQ